MFLACQPLKSHTIGASPDAASVCRLYFFGKVLSGPTNLLLSGLFYGSFLFSFGLYNLYHNYIRKYICRTFALLFYDAAFCSFYLLRFLLFRLAPVSMFSRC